MLLLVHRQDPEGVWNKIDWSVLLFFGALFVAVEAFATRYRSPVPAVLVCALIAVASVVAAVAFTSAKFTV